MKSRQWLAVLAALVGTIDAAPFAPAEHVPRAKAPLVAERATSAQRLSAGQPTLVPVIPPEMVPATKESLKLQKNGQLFFASREAHDTAAPGVAARLSMNYNFPSLILDHALETFKNVACNGPLMGITFHSEEYFQHVKQEWTSEHELVVITSESGCASYIDNSHHTYFKATDLQFHDETLVLTLKGQHLTLGDIVNDAHLEFGQIEHSRPSAAESQPERRAAAAVNPKKTSTAHVATSTKKAATVRHTTTTTGKTSSTTTKSSSINTSGTQCGALPSSTMSGLPAASCGPGFDQILDTAAGYYSFDDANFASTWASIAPGADTSAFIDPSDLTTPPAKRDLERRKFSVHFTFVAAIKSAAKAVVTKAVSKAVSAYNTLASIPAKAVSVVKAGIQLAKELIDGDPSVSLSLPLKYFMGGLDSSPWGAAKLLHVFKQTTKNPSAAQQAKIDEEIKKEGPELLPDNLADINHIAIYCVQCGFNGSFTATGKIGFSITGIHNATLDFVGNLDVTLGLGIDALALKTVKLAKKRLWDNGLPGFSIPKVIDFGPALYVEAGLNYEMKAIGQMLASSTHSYRNTKMHVDFIHPTNGYSSGWKPTTSKSIDVHGELSAGLVFELPVGLMFGLDVLGGKFSESVGSLVDTTSVELEAKVEFDLNATSSSANGSSSGASFNDGECYGVAWALSLHNQLNFDVLKLKNFKFFEEELPIANGCIGEEPPPEATETSTSTSSHPPITGPTIAACSVNGNRIQNGDFSSGQLDPFYIATDATDARNSYSVQDGYITTTENGITDNAYSSVTFRQNISLCQGQQYAFTMDFQYNQAQADVYTYGTIIYSNGTGVNIFGDRVGGDPAAIGQWETRSSDPWTADDVSVTFELKTIACNHESMVAMFRNLNIDYASGGSSSTKKRSQGRILGRGILNERQDDGSDSTVQLDQTADGSDEADDDTVNYDNLDPVNPDGSLNQGPDDSDLDSFTSDSVDDMESDANDNQDFADVASALLPPAMGGNATSSSGNVSLFPALPDANGISYLTLATADGAAQLSAGADGNLYFEAVDSSSTSGLFAATQGVIGGDFNGRLFHLYGNEMQQLNISRLRLSDETGFPIGALMATLMGVSAGGSNVMVASDTQGNIYYLAACTLQGQNSKIFLVQDPVAGLQTLQTPVASYTVTGGVASGCYLINFKPNTIAVSV